MSPSRLISGPVALLAVALTAVGLTPLPAAARPPSLVVAKASAASLSTGQVLDSKAAVTLAAGETATLIADDGRVLHLTGPFSGIPKADTVGQTGGLAKTVDIMTTPQQPSALEMGVSRAVVVPRDLPDPWLIDPAGDGHRCLRQGQRALFWQPPPDREMTLTVGPADDPQATVLRWPAGQDRLPLPADRPLRDGQDYRVALNGQESRLTVHVLPQVQVSNRALIAWLTELDCRAQAAALRQNRTRR